MRPPEHWHIRRRRPHRLRWLLVLAAAVAAAVVVAVQLRPSGGDTKPPAVETGCTAGLDCTPSAPQPSVGAESPPPAIKGRAAAVIEGSCGALLYGRSAHERLAPASLTKIATALVAVERADLADVVDVRVNSGLMVASTGSSVMGLEPGQRLSIRDLLYGLLLVSGNDAAIAIAEEVGGSDAAFVELMNRKVADLGLRDTHFANPHGLDEPGQYTTAFEIVTLGRELLAQPELAAIVRTQSYQPAWDGPQLWNGNELLGLYPEAIGVKTGYTAEAGQTIVAAAERDGRRIIVSVLGSWDRYSDAIALFEWAFAETVPTCGP